MTTLLQKSPKGSKAIICCSWTHHTKHLMAAALSLLPGSTECQKGGVVGLSGYVKGAAGQGYILSFE